MLLAEIISPASWWAHKMILIALVIGIIIAIKLAPKIVQEEGENKDFFPFLFGAAVLLISIIAHIYVSVVYDTNLILYLVDAREYVHVYPKPF